MLSSLGYCFFSHPEICSGDQSRISLLATMLRNSLFRQANIFSDATPSSRLADPHHGRDRQVGHHGARLPGSRWRPLDPGLCAIAKIEEPQAIPREMSSRSATVSANRERRRSRWRNPSARQQHGTNPAMRFARARRSHAATVPSSSDSKSHASRSQKALTSSLVSYQHHLYNSDLH